MSEETKDAMDEIIDSDENLEAQAEELAAKEDDIVIDEPEAKPAAKVDDLVKELEFLKKENKGLYHAQKNERQTRQGLQSQLDQLKGMMEEARAQRALMIDEAAEQSVEGVTTKKGVPVSFDDDGNPYVDPKELTGLANAEITALKKELEAMKSQNFQQETVTANKTIISNVIGENENYPAAYQHVRKAYQFLDDKSGEIMDRYGLSLQTTSLDEVMSLLERDYGEQFESQFPGLDIDVVVEACTVGPNGMFRPLKVQKALKSVLRSQGTRIKGDQATKNLNFFKAKGSNLSGQQNKKGSAGRTLNDIAESMSVDDFLGMDDKDFKRIERAAFALGE
ncbi:MAG: hypothetical protein SVV67_08760 [Bacillota bacterium]|nr:hypothetical protein [Bacillota bacterium]